MKDWFKRFFAMDNSINEQSVMGVFWAAVAFLLIIVTVIFKEAVGIELVGTTLAASLLCFGISGFKRG